MPLYEYLCHDCDQRVTLLVKGYAEPESPHCPECNGQHLTRVISQVAINQAETDRLRDMSWLDRDVKARLEKNARKDSLLG
jgi:putative FmdB family regulatory protein